MAIVNGLVVPRPLSTARSTTRHERIEPVPADGTHSRLLHAHDAQSTVRGANSLSQRAHRRIINVPFTVGEALLAVLPVSSVSEGFMATSAGFVAQTDRFVFIG